MHAAHAGGQLRGEHDSAVVSEKHQIAEGLVNRA
jgi:hypothetical protein